MSFLHPQWFKCPKIWKLSSFILSSKFPERTAHFRFFNSSEWYTSGAWGAWGGRLRAKNSVRDGFPVAVVFDVAIRPKEAVVPRSCGIREQLRVTHLNCRRSNNVTSSGGPPRPRAPPHHFVPVRGSRAFAEKFPPLVARQGADSTGTRPSKTLRSPPSSSSPCRENRWKIVTAFAGTTPPRRVSLPTAECHRVSRRVERGTRAPS